MDIHPLFQLYLDYKSKNTLVAQGTDLALLATFLKSKDYANPPSKEQLQTSAEAWRTITWQTVQAFVDWQLAHGHAITSINRRLSTVRTYAKLAAKSGELAPGEYAMITTISGYSPRAAKQIDDHRPRNRIGDKKDTSISITSEQVHRLKSQPDTPQGRRDALLMCLLLEHGLRVGELVLLQAENFDITAGTFYFERPKVDAEQLHQLSEDTAKALRAYILAGDAPTQGPLLRGSRKSGALTHAGISDRAIQARVRFLGEQIGLFDLSPHDCRHYWATYWAKKVDVLRLQEAGGWSSLDMPRRYVEKSRIANTGMTKA